MTNLMFFDAVSKGCNLSCSDPDSGPCVSQETCRCIREANQETCKIGQLPATALLEKSIQGSCLNSYSSLRFIGMIVI